MNVQDLVAYNLRRMRVAANLSQDILALNAEVERAYVGHLERASRNPTILTLEKLASALDCDVIEFFRPIPPNLPTVNTLRRGRKKA